MATKKTGEGNGEQQFRAVAETALDGIVSADARGDIVYFNGAAQRMFGYSPDEVLGRSLTMLMPERFHAAHRRGIERFVATGEARMIGTTLELAGEHKDGHEFPIELSLAHWTDESGKIAFSGIIREITERKKIEGALAQARDQLETTVAERTKNLIEANRRLQDQIRDRMRAEAAHRKSEQRWRSMIENAPVCVHEIDLQGRLISMNPAGLHMLGAETLQEIVGVHYLDLVAESDRPRIEALLHGALAGESADFEFRGTAAAARRVFASNFVPIKDESGSVNKLIGMTEDITERRRAESTQQFLLRELDHRVKNTLSMIQSVAKQTVRSATSLGDFEEAFEGRLRALAQLHAILGRENWVGFSLRQLVEMSLAPFHDTAAERCRLEGSAIAVSLSAVRPIGMALHELATNSLRHGALSVPDGDVRVSWRDVESTAHRRWLLINWNESGGPPVSEPSHEGVGMAVIKEGLTYELGGEVHLTFPETGVRCEIAVPFPDPFV